MRPVCLPQPEFTPPVGDVVSVSGFGTTSAESDDPSPKLLQVEVSVMSNKVCSRINNVYGAKVKDTMMCAAVVGGGKVIL